MGAKEGSLADWLDGLEEACDASDILIFAIAAAFAAPLLRFVPEREGAVFALLGPTSTGNWLEHNPTGVKRGSIRLCLK